MTGRAGPWVIWQRRLARMGVKLSDPFETNWERLARRASRQPPWMTDRLPVRVR